MNATGRAWDLWQGRSICRTVTLVIQMLMWPNTNKRLKEGTTEDAISTSYLLVKNVLPLQDFWTEVTSLDIWKKLGVQLLHLPKERSRLRGFRVLSPGTSNWEETLGKPRTCWRDYIVYPMWPGKIFEHQLNVHGKEGGLLHWLVGCHCGSEPDNKVKPLLLPTLKAVSLRIYFINVRDTNTNKNGEQIDLESRNNWLDLGSDPDLEYHRSILDK